MNDSNQPDDLVSRVKMVHRAFPSGVTIVTTALEGQPFGLAVNAFASITLAPPMVLVCINETSSTYPRFFAGSSFGISILASDQLDVARRFAVSGGNKFAGLDWLPGPQGQPLINGAAAQLELDIVSMLPAGTHTIFIGRVVTAAASGKAPLVYHNAGFFDGGALTPATDRKGTSA
ncbi:MAG: flavin reductase family protein [Rhodobacteraceae bacterium]|jgi:flavin reductase (DIM6/NTAB) family NADH-FMN oxidoreductase RutF|nr:flavin reductase family protein [Paracoccaceae bacterium]